MLKRWITYLAVLTGAIAFYGIYDGYNSYFLLISVLLFPFFTLAISLFGMLRMRICLQPLPTEIKRGEVINAELNINPRCIFPLSLIKITYTARNITFSRNQSKVTTYIYGCTETNVPLPLDTSHVGCIFLDISRVKVYDYIGLFSLSVKTPEKRHITIMPNTERPVPMPSFPIDKINSKGLKPKPGGGFAEDYDLREYRIGDPINAVHWKLTSKLKKLVIREPLISEKGKLLICFNLFGKAEDLDSVFGQITYISFYLLRRMIEFNLCWYGIDGHLNVIEIKEADDYLRFLSLVFMNPIEPEGRAIDEEAYKDSDWHYFVSSNLQNKGDDTND
ncbi:MAG: DUF58 domain-containing protein [Eubacteriales bacterium]|nr:DUF58 domain-containing protein [Eubacteriales bacterium]